MRTITPLFFLVSVSGTLVSCAPDGKNSDSTKDSSSTDSTVVDLDTDELSSGDVQQIVFNSTTPFAYHHEYWSGRDEPNTDKVADNTQPGDVLLYVNVDGTYVAGTGTWSVEDLVTGNAHDLFEITAGATDVPRLSVRELDGTSGFIGGSSSLTSLSRGDEVYRLSIRDFSSGNINQAELAYCKSSNNASTNNSRLCVDCVQPDGSPYTGALGTPQDSNVYCDVTAESEYFGANVVYNDGTNTVEELIWLETHTISYTAPTISSLENRNDGSTGGFTYAHTDGTELVLDDGGDATYVEGTSFEFNNSDPDKAAEFYLRLYGCTTSDLLYVESGSVWDVDNQDELDYNGTRVMDLSFRPGFSSDAVWNSSNDITTYPSFTSATSGDLDDYCELEVHFRDAANSSSPDYVQELLRSVTYRYSDGNSTIGSEGLRTVQAYLINEDDPGGGSTNDFAVVSAPSEIDIAVYNNPTLTDNTTATVFDATPTVDIEADYSVSLAVSGTYSDGGPCFIDVSTLTASTSTNVTFTKSNGAGLPDGIHTCMITPTRTVTPTRVTDGETLSFDFTGSIQTFSLTVDTTPPNVTIDSEVANVNGYTNSLTPTFDVSSDEAGTLTVGGSCSITGQSTIAASSSTTITLDALTAGTTYSDCTVIVTDDAGNASTPVTLSAFTVDVTNPSISYSLVNPLSINSNATDDSTPDLEIAVPVTESNVTMSVNSGTTSACAISSGALSGAGVTNTITFTADSGGTAFTDGQIQCLVDLTDLAGNTAQETISFYVDVAAPVISVTSQPSTPTGLPTFSLDTNENGTLSLSGDCATGTVGVSGSASISDTSGGSPAQVSISGLSEGSYYTCEVVVTDIAGRATSASVNSFAVDTTSDAPVIAGITSDTGSSSTDGVTNAAAVEFTGTSEASAEVTLTITDTGTSTSATCITTANGSGAWTCNASSSSLDTYAADLGAATTTTSYTVTATAIDSLSNSASSASNAYNLTVDLASPNLSVGTMGTVSESNPTVTLTSDESGVSVFEVGTGLTDDCANLSYTRTADTTNGNDFILQHATNGGFANGVGYACTATVTDSAGNTSTDQTFTFDVSLSGVVISESGPADATTGSGNVTSSTAPTVKIYSNTAIDEANGDTFGWTGGCETSGTILSANGVTELTLVATGGSAFANDGTADGVYDCTLEVIENATSTTSNALTLSSFTIDTTGPTVAVTDTDSNVGTSISFEEILSAGTTVATVTGTDTFATTVTYTEDSSGDATANGIFEIDSSTGVVSLTTTASQGTYTYSVIVSDDALPTNNTTSESITFTVVEGNAAPVLDDAYVANFTVISEHITNTANVGQAVSTLLTDGTTPAITDANTTSVQGIAIYDATATGSSEWQYSGDNGTTWTQITGVDAQSVLVLADTDLLRLSPTVANGETGTLSFYAWDQTDGTQYNIENVNTRGGTTAYSTASATVSITVNDVNDAPTLVSGTTVSLTAITEGSTSSATLLNSAVSSLITDTDTASGFASLGVAVVGMTEAAPGSWQYSTDGGSSWSNFSDLSSTLSETAAFLIDASGANGQIRFASSAPNGETATLTFFAWDQSSGTAGTQVDITTVYNDTDSPYSAPDATDIVSNGGNAFSIIVNDENDAPVLVSTVVDFTPIAEYETTNTGSTVSTLLNGALTDVDTTSSQGIAIYSVVAGNGAWEYSADGTNWTAFPTVSSTGALVLTDTDSIRFVPSNTNADSASITYYGWDQSDSSSSGSTVDVSSTGGSTAFSTANATSSITVTDANNQPVLDTTTSPIAMTAFNEGDVSSTTTSAALLISAGIGSTISDVDTGASSGIAITSASTSNGYWEYSADNTNWTAVPTVSTTSAMVLDASYYLRFVSTGPDGVTATLDFVAWDQTDVNTSETTAVDTTATFSPSNISPFSATSNTLSVVVTDLNDAPELAGVTTSLGTITEDDADVADSDVTTYQLSTVLSTIITDTDTTSAFNNLGIAVTGVSSTNGRWDSSLDGNTWTEIVGASLTNVLVLDDSAFIRFIPDGTAGTTAELTFLAWDQSDSETSGSFVTISSGNQGNDGAYSLNEGTFSVTVTDVNDQPVITGSSSVTLTPAIQEGQLSSAFNLFTELDPLNTITDSDEAPLTTVGVALTSASTTRGYWEYSTDGENTWSTVPSTTSTSDALLFDVSSATVAPSVRFQATGNNGVTAELIVYAWDQSSSPSPADVGTANSTNGTTSAFSSSSVSLTLQVNDINNQPVLDISTSPIVLTAINEGDTGTPTTSVVDISSVIDVSISDSDNNASSGIAITSASTSNGYWEYSADNTNWTAVPTVSTTSAMVLDASYYLRFVSTGPDGVTAILDFVAWDQTDGYASEATGADTTTNSATTSAYSVDGNSLSLLVNDLNDAPELAGVTTSLGTITEDDADVADSDVTTYQLSTVLSTIITDTDTTSAFNNLGIAVTGVSSTNGRWDSSLDGNTWTEIVGASLTNVLVLDDSAFIRFIPDGTDGTTAELTFLAWDQSDSETSGSFVTISSGNQGDAGAYSLNEDTFSVTVTDVNDQPVLDTTTSPLTLTAINEGDVDAITYATALISAEIGSTISDADSADPSGIAITAASTSNGYWEYTLDGSTWNAIPTVSTTSALVLDSADSVRFASTGPDGVTATLDFMAWDQTDGSNAGDSIDTTATFAPAHTSPFSTNSNTLSVVVTDLNDAPELSSTSTTIDLGTISEDDTPTTGLTTFQVSTVVASNYTDTDTTSAFNNLGIAVTSVSTTNGYWEYSMDAETTWTAIPGVSTSTVLLLDGADFVRFVPNEENGSTATLDFYGWDQSNNPTLASNNTTTLTSGEQGDAGAYSLTGNQLSLTVSDVNDAPVYTTTGTTTLTALTEDDVDNSGQIVSAVVGANTADVDAGAVYGIAVTGLTSGVGTWEFNLNDGSGWQSVEGSTTLTTSNARAIPSTASLRFNPNAAAENGESTDPTIAYYVWDQTTGTAGALTSTATVGGTTAFSTASETASVVVSDVNDAPVVASASNFTTITEDDNQTTNPTLIAQISSLVTLTDVDNSAPAEGIAIIGQTATNGVWKYSLDGANWATLSISTGALVLDIDDYLAFVPNESNGGTSELEFYGWDQYSTGVAPVAGTNISIASTGASTPFSATSTTIEIVVTDVNDSPVWPTGTQGANFTAITEDQINNSGNTVSDLLNALDSDEDAGSTRGIAVYAIDLGSNGTGTWEYSVDAGANWSSFPSVSVSAALALRETDKLRFVPDGDNGESTNPYVDFYLWDGNPAFFGTQLDATTRADTDDTANFSANSGRSEIVVSDVNDAPVIVASTLGYSEGETLVQLNATDAVGSNSSITITEVDIGDTLEVVVTLPATNWPYDPVAPDDALYTRTFNENNVDVVLDVVDEFGGTLNTSTTSWDSNTNSLTLTGSVTSINAELATLSFTPTAGLTPTDSATVSEPDFDLDTVVSIAVSDATTGSDSQGVTLSCDTDSNDRPIAIVYWEAYENENGAENANPNRLLLELTEDILNNSSPFVRVDAIMSWDPDDQDDIVSYTFTPNIPVSMNCAGTLLPNATSCTLTNGDSHITYEAINATITWTVSVEDNSGQSNTVANLHDQTIVSIANQPPEVTVYLASEADTCTRAHATGTLNPVYADMDADCFCEEANCGQGNPVCADRDGITCNPTLDNQTFPTCVEMAATYADANRGTSSACYCEELDCDGTDDLGEPNCFDELGQTCTPVLAGSLDSCAPVVSPNDLDFPYDVNLELVACAYDPNGDTLNFNWSVSSGLAVATETLNTSAETAYLKVTPGAAGYVASDTLDLTLEVTDVEDTISRTMDFNFCAGWFQDADGDGYGALGDYEAACSSSVSSTFDMSMQPDTAVSVVQGNDYLGLDCLDAGIITDDSNLYGNLASVVELTAAQVQDRVNWYVDYDDDGYGAMFGGRGDNGNGQFELTDGGGNVTDTFDIVYSDVNNACTMTNPTVTLSTGEVKNYLLNSDDCNDILDFADGVYTESPTTSGVGASSQNPETIWYADIDGDGFAIGMSTDTSANFLYPDADFDCLCTSASGSCSSLVNNYQLVTGLTSTSCVKTGSLYSYKIKYQQCNSPTEATNTSSLPGLPVSWVLNNGAGFGDCDETNALINEGAQERCDSLDVDEDCDGLADDNDNNGTVSGALTYFVDNDGDAYPTAVGKVFSCDGNTSSGASSLVYYYTLDPTNATINSSTITSGQCICPTDTCDEACRLASDSSISCSPTDTTVFTNGNSHCAGISNSSGNFNFTKTPFDFTGTTFADFAPFVQDCDDNSNDVYPRATEACDGVLNDCVNIAGGVPTDEVDYDNDGYVECEFDGSNWNGANTPLVGADCAPVDTNVYPNAPSICDGQYNNCASWRQTYVDVDRECFCFGVDANDPSLCDVNTCVDSEGSSCAPALDSSGAQACDLWEDVTERYVDEAGSCFCDTSNNQGNCDSEVCHTAEGIECTPVDLDGNGFAECSEIAFENKMSPGAPANQVDDDGDCYVECYDGTTSWAGGTALLGSSCSDIMEGQDCNDTVSLVYPGAIEVCDGQFNNCNSPSFSATGAPVNETDNDGDGFVECLDGEYMDLNGCRCLSATDDGSGGLIYNQCTNSRGQSCTPNSTVAEVTWVTGSTGYGDCDDLDDSRYPSAPEICDGIFNDCEHPLLEDFVGASGADCFCEDNVGSNCVDASGATCTVNVNLVDLVRLTTPETVGGSNYEFQQVECYCSTSDCQIDVDGDGASDCLNQNDDPCIPTDADSDGFADTCIVEPLNAQTSVALSQSMYAFSGAPGRELDNDGDNYVDCNYTAGLWVGSAYVVGGLDCNDFPTNNGSRVYPSATEHCDGIYNNCSDATYSATNPPTDESDVDNDGFVECTLTPGYAWVGDETPLGYADCVDTDRLVYPGATEACDGIFNNCSSNGYSATSAPITEQDNDGDGFVECSDVYYADANSCVCQGVVDSTGTLNYTNCLWNQSTCIPDLTSIVPLGWSGDTITGYEDCDDTNATIYPSATEVCDGRFNDCDHPLKPSGSNGGVYSGVVGDCFCAVVDTDADGTVDACDATDCVDSNNNTCTPIDDDQDGLVDVCEIADTTGTDFVNTSTYFGAEVDCYCPSIDCMMDATGNAVTDCYTPDGSTCNMPIDNNGLAEDCLTSLASPVLSISHIFVDSIGVQVAKPWEEIDNDADGYVECDEFDLSTYRAGGGSFSVVGGSDCNDGDGYVYPAATEYCDGVFNDCEDVAYDIQPAPADEIDNDGDGFVECTFTTGVNWRGDTAPTGDEDCDDTRATVYPNAVEICDGLFNNCSIYNYSATGAPTDETDDDGDGYVECSSGGYVDSSGCACDAAEDTDFDGVFDTFTNCLDGFGQTCTPVPEELVGVVWEGPTEPTGYGDCLDSDPEQFPSAEEICDGLFNNCAHPQKSAFEGVVSDCMCPTADTNGDGDDDACVATGCLDGFGQTCTPVDENADGYVDAPYCAISTTPEQVTGQGLMGVEVDCYCPSTNCQLDVLGDGSSDCLTPTGDECIPSDNNNVGFADACLTDTEGLTITHAFLQANGNALTRPFNETDNDGDGYVECEYIEETWLGSFNVVGGLDCDDADGAVYPTAAELCDGQFNDCANNYVENSAPVDELDNDGDGWIECSRDIDVVWNAFDGSLEPNNYGYGTDGILFGSSVCVCDTSSCSTNCTDDNGNSCVVPAGECNRLISYDYTDCDDADQYAHPFVALNEYEEAGDGIGIFSCVRDRDGDGYGDANPSNPLVEAGHDCDDSNLYVHPQQNEICEVGDQIDSDCNGNVNTAEYQDGFILDTNGQGSLLYVDADGDGFGDSEIAATPACEVSSGFVFNATDCNDEDSTINPNSKEICDGIDQDCDLTIDEPDSLDDPAVSKCTYMYRDVDADSYGDADYSACLCQEGSNPSVTYNDYEYVIYSGDCYDYNADIKPLSCSDGIDQDDDGFVDDEDPNCIAGFQEGSDTIKEEAFELLDGHDNNCDGLVAAVELDCDDDGSFALVPGESSGFNRSAKFQMAADIGLEACSGLSTTIDCWGDPQRLVCDALTAEINDGSIEYKGTGLWMLSINESDDGYSGRFDGGHREYPEGRTCGATRGDCDDQCPDRCPDQVESCDGIDNDCSNASPGVDGHAGDSYLGIPDAMIAEVPIEGTISDAEIDIDSDGYLACESFISSGAQNQWSDESCDTTISVSEDNDCNNYCFFTSPTAEERCDAFQGTCGGENLEGTDNDYDDMLTCGTWGADETLAEDIYMVVWMKDVDWSRLASEEHELIRPVRTADDIARVLAEPSIEDSGEYFDTAGDTGSVDTASEYESLQETESEGVLRKRRDFINERLPIMNTNAGFIGGDIEIDLLERMIPLVSPRALAPYCDSYLMDQLTLLLGIDNMEALRQADDPKEQADILLEACDQSVDGVAGCGVVRLSLSRTTDDETYEYLDAIQSEILSFSTECEDKPEEWISRSMWQRERIVEARTITVEWECRRMFGQACDEISDQTSLVDGWQDSIVSPERWLDVDRAWFKEIGRYNPEAIDGGTLMSCWGDPTDPTAKFSEEVGGDCADDDLSAHRDMPEGPGDLVGLYLYGEMADCDTCLDGIDNNCDGAIDCADPACAPCFVGQGVGCGGGADSPCSQGGCASPDQSGKERMYRSFGLIMMAMFITIIRRREKRYTA